MSDTESDGTRANAAPPAKSPPAKAGVWQAVKRGLIRTEAELSYFKGLTWFGLVSTLLVAYFQNLSAYHNKVATLAQTDTAAATDTFTEATTNLSLALTLQQRLIQDFYAALNNNAYQDDTFLSDQGRPQRQQGVSRHLRDPAQELQSPRAQGGDLSRLGDRSQPRRSDRHQPVNRSDQRDAARRIRLRL